MSAEPLPHSVASLSASVKLLVQCPKGSWPAAVGQLLLRDLGARAHRPGTVDAAKSAWSVDKPAPLLNVVKRGSSRPGRCLKFSIYGNFEAAAR